MNLGNPFRRLQAPTAAERSCVLERLRRAYFCCDSVTGQERLRKPVAPIPVETLLDPCGEKNGLSSARRAIEVCWTVPQERLLRLAWTGGHRLEVRAVEVEPGRWVYLLVEEGSLLLLGGAEAGTATVAHRRFLDSLVGTNGEEYGVPLIVGVPEAVWLLGQEDFEWAHGLFLRAMKIAAEDFGEGVWEPVLMETAARLDGNGRDLREKALRLYLSERMN